MAYAHGDVRTEARGEWFVERVIATGSLKLHKIGEDRAGEMAAHRFLSSRHVSVASISATVAARTAAQCAGRHIVLAQDTTEVSFGQTALRRDGFGPAGNGEAPGFFIHPVIAMDAEVDTTIGLCDINIWTRRKKRVTDRHTRPLEKKESIRWLDACHFAAEALADAASLTMLADREGDIYDLFAERPAKLDLIIRSTQDRECEGGGKLYAALADAPISSCEIVQVAPQGIGDKGREAKVEIRHGRVRMKAPKVGKRKGRPDSIEITLVEAREINAPKSKKPLLWRLLTTHQVDTPQEAAKVVSLYRRRWRIEQTFRALKSEGLKLEDSQIADAGRMFVLAAIALVAAVRTIQLVDARDGSTRPATDVIDEEFIEPLARLSTKLEGKTERQKNPHPHASLAWVAWITARLGGWNCYYKPPGPKTMRDGWTHLATFLAGYALAAEANV